MVELALQRDESARRELQQLRATVQLVQSLPRHPAPAAVANAVRAHLERQALIGEAPARTRPTRSRLFRVTQWLSAAAVFGLLAWAGWWSVGTEAPGRSDTRMAGGTEAAGTPMKPAEQTPAPSTLAGVPMTRNDAPSGPTFEEKQSSGADWNTLSQHAFAGEPVRLQVYLADERERDAVAQRIGQRLQQEQFVDAGQAPESAAVQGAARRPLYFEGRAGVNFDNPQQRQILVQAPPAQVAMLMNEIRPKDKSSEQLWLRTPTKTIGGFDEARTVLETMSPSGPAVQDGRESDSLGLYGPFMDAIGITKVLPSREPEQVAASREAKSEDDREQVEADSDEASAVAQSTAKKVEVDSPQALSERTSFVERRLRELEEQTRSGAAASGERNKRGEHQPFVPRDKGGEAAFRGIAESIQNQQPGGLITLILELVIPEAADPAKKTPEKPSDRMSK